jgi:putative ABC transport system permease protein
MKEKGQGSMANFDDGIIIPYNVLQRDVMGIKHFQRLVVEIDNEKNINATVQDIKDTIRDSHNISDPDKDDFHVNTSADIANAAGTVLGTLTIFLAAVAAISLLVGGVGIMNIVLVSVTERTREIGLRKALGATSKEILAQFLLESVLLTSSGGAIGITLGTLLSYAASVIITKFAGLDWAFSFPWQAALLGFGVSAGIGLVFGLYPAKKASDLSPIEALRYE